MGSASCAVCKRVVVPGKSTCEGHLSGSVEPCSPDIQSHPISVVIADAHPMLSGSLEKLFTNRRDIFVASSSVLPSGFSDALAETARAADVVVLHVGRVTKETERAIQGFAEITGLHSKPYVLVVSAAESDEEVLACIRFGARGYVNGAADFGTLLHTVQLVARGGMGFATTAVAGLAGAMGANTALPAKNRLAGLTKREQEIVRLLAQGYDNRNIARTLYISERTVRNHLTRVFLKLGVPNRLRAAMVAQNWLEQHR